jgi:glycosyltransferase involved in cell wall biosynthesis
VVLMLASGMPEDKPFTKQPVVLWWGRSKPGYARNMIVRRCFEELGWEVRDFRPLISQLGHLQAQLYPQGRADLIWVPCFRQRDIAAARRYARSTGTPLCIDPLISAYDKQVDERAKYAPGSAAAIRLKRWESRLFTSADRIIADTQDHADYFVSVLGADRQRITVVPVGADESMFKPTQLPSVEDSVQVLFYGSFLALQGPQFIVQAARHLQATNVRITLLGDGPLHAQCARAAHSCPLVHFEPWIDYRDLPARIAQAHLLLGVFGTTPKAARVIPNKVYQALASARPVVTRAAPAYPACLRSEPSRGLQFVAAGDPRALASVLDALAAEPQSLFSAGRAAHKLYQQMFSTVRVQTALSELLLDLDLPSAGESPHNS